MKKILCLLLALVASSPVLADIDNFRESKAMLKEHVYLDQTRGGEGTFYCGCDWRWVGESGGRVDASSCGYEVRAQENRAERTEWEHVVPAWVMGHQRQCWQDGGRRNCRSTDPVFQVMEADPHNLVVSVGEANADRSNFEYGVLADKPTPYGRCDLEVDFKQRVVEPRDAVKGQIARIYFYIHDRYDLRMSRQQQQLMMAWHRQYPVTTWERERDARIARMVGHNNPFVTGEQQWTLGHKNTAEGLKSFGEATLASFDAPEVHGGGIRGNRNSKIYHLPEGCPSYDRVSPRNVIEFSSESEAQSAGYRKAGNCR
ncbi:DNA-specific endonuclease I [Alcanivorax nanhaiticus]|jgi:deoxyribonuclease-1|uniref:DNA-specific endonuclease I n=1 Tax=Alcanivorax nanhaiticus TaxID=1177154 RepID=A0A095ULI9_9GAMM|nr:endonuclease [Alcanivorax nanhaiticus]KGD63385.1 DNA-specific endonuclease I [Alcanivorax nanhaiticus]HIB08923.1 deoxyribonuclease I [Gemmatimonadota bacterium]|tara:strand:- start:2652 stop:3596 length:945 start_codon:yes stop_codon:yes gene_type:complete